MDSSTCVFLCLSLLMIYEQFTSQVAVKNKVLSNNNFIFYLLNPCNTKTMSTYLDVNIKKSFCG